MGGGWRVQLTSLILAFACNAPPASPTGWTTRFYREPDWTLDEATQKQLFEVCPPIRVVSAERTSANFLKVTVASPGAPRIERVGALLEGNQLANAHHKVRDDGTLAFPVACGACTIVFGVRLPQGLAACTGTGFSLSVQGDRVF